MEDALCAVTSHQTRSKVLMTTEKLWWFTSYAEDIHKHLRYKERRRYLFRGQSPQLYLRKKMISFMDKICYKMEFSTTVEHLAVYLLDIFMDNHVMHADHWQMVTVGCLTVAVKLEEKDKVPKHSDFIPYLANQYKLSAFVQMEVSILTFFNWDILFPTAAHFTEYYLIYSVNPTDLLNGKPVPCYHQIEVFVKKYIDYFLDVVICDHEYLAFSPSLIAASCIASTRRCMLIEPIWPEILQNITYYSYSQVQPCMELLTNALDKDMLAQNKASGKKRKDSPQCSKIKACMTENTSEIALM